MDWKTSTEIKPGAPYVLPIKGMLVAPVIRNHIIELGRIGETSMGRWVNSQTGFHK